MENQTAEITSHFIAVSVIGVEELFSALNEYINEKDINTVIILRDVKTAHISLDYLDKEIDEVRVRNLVVQSAQYVEGLTIPIKGIVTLNENAVCLQIEDERLRGANKVLRSKLQSGAKERGLEYQPHITLFTVEDQSVYQQHKENIERIVQSKSGEVLSDKVNLYTANSKKKPELQMII